MTTKFYSYSYKNKNGDPEEEEVTIENGKGKIVKKQAGKIILNKEITMEELEDYMEEKGLNITISQDVLNQAVNILNTMMNSKQGRKNLEQLQELDLLDINENEENDEEDSDEDLSTSESLNEDELDQCKKILKIFGVENDNPTKDEFLTVYNKMYNSYLQKCKGLNDSELEECENKLKNLEEDFEAYSEEFNCWDDKE